MEADLKIKNWRLAGSFAIKVALSHLCDHDIPFILNIGMQQEISPHELLG
jgi:hypothetical protein